MFGNIMNTEAFRISFVTDKATQTFPWNVPHFGGGKELRSALGLMSIGDCCSLCQRLILMGGFLGHNYQSFFLWGNDKIYPNLGADKPHTL